MLSLTEASKPGPIGTWLIELVEALYPETALLTSTVLQPTAVFQTRLIPAYQH